MSRTRRIAMSAWLGFALAALFFYPLAAAIDSNSYYLQWQPAHAVEVGVALALLAPVFGALVFATWQRNGRGGTVAVFLVALVPLLSVGAGVSRQLPIGAQLRVGWENPIVGFGVPSACAVLIAAAFAVRPLDAGRWMRRLLLVISPLALIVVKIFVASAAYPGPPLTIDRQATPAPAGARCSSVLALLFDELSFAYLFDGSEVREEYPEMRRFTNTATNYLSVTAAGSETLTSVPAYLASRRFDNIRTEGDRLVYELGGTRASFNASEPDGLFATARRAGLSPEVAGYYLAYCALLGSLVDACRSFSFYNIATADDGFSPLHPILTSLILWPRQFPLGLLKNPPFARLQHNLVEQSLAFALRPIDPAQPVFRFVHFSIPHLPFVYDEQGYNPPFDPLRQIPDDQYVRQIHYVDHLFGQIVEHVRQAGVYERTTVILFADHGFRSSAREHEVRHVPFIVKKAGQTTRIDVMEPQQGELLLRQLVESSCTASR